MGMLLRYIKKNWKVANLMCFLEIREVRSNLNIVYFAF